MSLWPQKRQWKSWTLPSKLTAIGTLIGLISLALYGIEKSPHLRELFGNQVIEETAVVPDILVKIENNGKSEVKIYSRGEFVLWFPQGVSNRIQTVSGKYRLVPLEQKGENEGLITIKPSKVVPIVAKLQNQKSFARILERGDTDLNLIFRRRDGSVFFSANMPFTKEDLSKYYLLADASIDKTHNKSINPTSGHGS